MKVNLSERVKTALKTLSRDDRERIQTWFDYLQDWDENSFAKARSVPLTVHGQSMYMFRTSTEIRIFFTIDELAKTLCVIDIATQDTILSSGGVAAGAS